MESNYNYSRLGVFKHAIQMLFVAYNKQITDVSKTLKAQAHYDMMPALEDEQIPLFYKKISQEVAAIPSDAQIRSYYGTRFAGTRSAGGDPELGKYGYYDENGAYIVNGTYHCYLEADLKQLNKRQREVRAAFEDKEKPFTDEMRKEHYKFLLVQFPVPKGSVQKPRHAWSRMDYLAAGIDEPEEAAQF